MGIVAPVVFCDTLLGGVAQMVEQTAHIRSVRGPSPFAAILHFSCQRPNGYGVRGVFFFGSTHSACLRYWRWEVEIEHVQSTLQDPASVKIVS